MSITLFVRSYGPDYKWLTYAIASMQKYLTGYATSMLVVPEGEVPPQEAFAFFDSIIYSRQYNSIDGYIGQQLDKLDAYKYVETEHILYTDSDCIYTDYFNLEDMFSVKQPILYMTPYYLLPPQGGHWQGVVEKALGFVPTHEFMRTFPIMHRTETVRELSEAYPHLYNHAQGITNRAFSEFNCIGAFAYQRNHPYYFTEDIKPWPCTQYWSWGGISPSIKTEIESIINGTH